MKFCYEDHEKVETAIKASRNIPDVTSDMECDFFKKEYRASGSGATMYWSFRYPGGRKTHYAWIEVRAGMKYDPDDGNGATFLWDGLVWVSLCHGKDSETQGLSGYGMSLLPDDLGLA
jgi:hypothetical protein